MEIRNENYALMWVTGNDGYFCTPKTSFESLINPMTMEGVESFKIATSVSMQSKILTMICFI